MFLGRRSRRRAPTDFKLGGIVHGGARRAIRHGSREKGHMAMQFRVEVEIEGASPETFKIGLKFSDEEGSDMEFYCNHDLPEDVSEKLGDLAVDFINNIGDVVLRRLH
jgi:hypothetical protein